MPAHVRCHKASQPIDSITLASRTVEGPDEFGRITMFTETFGATLS
jgi:hypothetical protein